MERSQWSWRSAEWSRRHTIGYCYRYRQGSGIAVRAGKQRWTWSLESHFTVIRHEYLHLYGKLTVLRRISHRRHCLLPFLRKRIGIKNMWIYFMRSNPLAVFSTVSFQRKINLKANLVLLFYLITLDPTNTSTGKECV